MEEWDSWGSGRERWVTGISGHHTYLEENTDGTGSASLSPWALQHSVPRHKAEYLNSPRIRYRPVVLNVNFVLVLSIIFLWVPAIKHWQKNIWIIEYESQWYHFLTRSEILSPFWLESWKGQKFDSAAPFMPVNQQLRDHNKIQWNKLFLSCLLNYSQFVSAKTSKIEVWKHESNSITATMQCAFQRNDKALLQHLTPQKYPGKGERFSGQSNRQYEVIQKSNQLISINSTFSSLCAFTP